MWINKTETSDGLTPLVLEACPMVCGRMVFSLCRPSRESVGTLS